MKEQALESYCQQHWTLLTGVKDTEWPSPILLVFRYTVLVQLVKDYLYLVSLGTPELCPHVEPLDIVPPSLYIAIHSNGLSHVLNLPLGVLEIRLLYFLNSTMSSLFSSTRQSPPPSLYSSPCRSACPSACSSTCPSACSSTCPSTCPNTPSPPCASPCASLCLSSSSLCLSSSSLKS